METGREILDVFEDVGMEGIVPIMLHLVSEDIVRNNQTENSLYQSRATLNRVLGDSTEADKLKMSNDYQYEDRAPDRDGFHQNYIEPTEDGYPGLEAPL